MDLYCRLDICLLGQLAGHSLCIQNAFIRMTSGGFFFGGNKPSVLGPSAVVNLIQLRGAALLTACVTLLG